MAKAEEPLTKIHSVVYAEAEARQGQYAKARTFLATVSERAGYTEDDVKAIADSDLLGEILQHKLCDMSNENLEEWFDLCRYNRQVGFESWTEDEKAELPSFRRHLPLCQPLYQACQPGTG